MADCVDRPKVEQITWGESHLWPRFSPSGERIASVQQRADFNEHLYVTDLKTRQSTRVSDRIAHHPCWVDDDQLAYLSFDASADQTQVRVVSLATGVNTSWTHFTGKAEWLAVRPGRKDVAIVMKPPKGSQKIVLRNLEKQADLIVAEGAEYERLRWSPGGLALSWSGSMSSGAATNGVWMSEPGIKPSRRIVSDGYGPVWAANGVNVYFFRPPQSLLRLNVRQNALTELRAPGGRGMNHYDLAGERLVFIQFFQPQRNLLSACRLIN